GESVDVPEINGMQAEKATQFLEDMGLELRIIDSVYQEDQSAMAIVDQDPHPGMKVKPGRVIYVTVNTGIKPKVKMPQLVNGGLNLAKVLVQNSGLKVGRIDSMESEMGAGLVLKQLYKGKPVAANTLLEKGSIIDITVSKKPKIYTGFNDSASTPEPDPFEDF